MCRIQHTFHRRLLLHSNAALQRLGMKSNIYTASKISNSGENVDSQWQPVHVYWTLIKVGTAQEEPALCDLSHCSHMKTKAG